MSHRMAAAQGIVYKIKLAEFVGHIEISSSWANALSFITWNSSNIKPLHYNSITFSQLNLRKISLKMSLPQLIWKRSHPS